MSEKDPEYVIKLEKAIKKKYGGDAIQNPKASWSDEKEQKYLEELKEISKRKTQQNEKVEKVETDGFLVSKQLLTPRGSSRVCPVCSIYSFEMKDDMYMSKFECCFQCYVKWVENREERWISGWRPNKEE
jgi:hypothetical protein